MISSLMLFGGMCFGWLFYWIQAVEGGLALLLLRWMVMAIALTSTVFGLSRLLRPARLTLSRAGFTYDDDVLGFRFGVQWSEIDYLGIYTQFQHNAPFVRKTQFIVWNYKKWHMSAYRQSWQFRLSKHFTGFDRNLAPYWSVRPEALLETMEKWRAGSRE